MLADAGVALLAASDRANAAEAALAALPAHLLPAAVVERADERDRFLAARIAEGDAAAFAAWRGIAESNEEDWETPRLVTIGERTLLAVAIDRRTWLVTAHGGAEKIPRRSALPEPVARLLAGAFKRFDDAAVRQPDQQALSSSFERAFDVSPLMLSITKLDTGQFIAVNEAFIQASGFTRGELIGRTPVELNMWITPEQRADGRSEIQAGRTVRNQELRFRSKDGSVRDYLLSGALVDFDGHVGVLTALTDITERNQAQTLLTRYRLLAENLRDILIFFRGDGSIVEANQAACDAYGYSADELTSLNLTDLRAPETHAEIPGQIAQALASGIRFETRHRRRDGSTFPVEVVSQSADFGGERLVLSLIRDVTERTAAESALRASEARLRLALDAARMSTWEFDFTTGRRSAGGNHAELMGADPDLIEDLYALIHPDDRERVRHAIAVAAEQGGGYAEEYRLLHSSGETRWIAAQGRAIGSPVRLVGVAHDISDRKRAESQLRASEERFRVLAETMPLLVWSCDPDGYCDFLSRQWLDYTGIPIEPQLGYGWTEQVHPDDRDGLLRAWTESVAAGNLFDVEFRIKRHDGAYRWFKTRAAPVRDDDGAIVKWYGSNTDIDDLKQVEERRRVLIDTLAHDLKNPLAAIKAQSQVLRRRLLRGHAIDEDNLAMMAETASNMAELIDEMSDASKLAAGQELELEPSTFDLVTMLERAAIAYGGTSSRHEVRVAATVERLIGSWDRARLERVFGNLLANAIKYSPAGGDVLVQVNQTRDDRGEWAIVSVSDQGIGIAESELALVFERRRRGSNVGQIRGNGLGLAGAADVIRLHGGEITVASREGAGSTFTVRLPIAMSAPIISTNEHD